MPTIDLDDRLWAELAVLGAQAGLSDPGEIVRWCVERARHLEDVIACWYCPLASVIVTRNDSELLLVGNRFVDGGPLVWGLPGGVAAPGESLVEAAARELREETGLEMLAIGRLAWVAQWVGPVEPNDFRPLVCAFEAAAWRGVLTLANEVEDGDVRRVEFVPYDVAWTRMFRGANLPTRHWITAPRNTPRFYRLAENGDPVLVDT